MAQTAQRDGRPGGRVEQTHGPRTERDGGESAGKRRKLVLIEPGAPGKHVYSLMKLPRLGAVLLGTIMRDRGWDVRVYAEDVAPVDYEDVLTADVIGISTITSTATRAYAMADSIREYGLPVVMGGPHVTFLAEEALNHCDYVVRGEGEEALPALLDALFENGELGSVPNLSYRGGDGTIRETAQTSVIEDLDSLPHPDFDLIVGGHNALGFRANPVYPIMTSRGCTHGCTFCSVIRMFGRRMRHRSVDHVMDELEKTAGEKRHVFFYDDNFTADREKSRALLGRAERTPGLWRDWSAQVHTDVTRDEPLLSQMKRAGCAHVYVGFETVNPAALKATRKGQSVDGMRDAARRFKQHGIDVHGMFVFGFDTDSAGDLKATTRFAKESGILSAQFLLLTPLPGTPLFEEFRADGRLIMHDWAHFDGHHVVYAPRNLSAWELQWAQIKSHALFYSGSRAAMHLLRGYVTGSLIYLYAWRVLAQWKKSNRVYLKALKLTEKARDLRLHFDLEFDLSEIKRQVAAAAQALSLSRIQPQGA